MTDWLNWKEGGLFALFLLPCAVQGLVIHSSKNTTSTCLFGKSGVYKPVNVLPFWGRLVHFSQHFKTVGRDGSFNCLNSSLLTSLRRATKIYPKATKCCVLIPCYTAPAPLEWQSGREWLPTKMFSCVSALHTLGGFNGGWSKCLLHPYWIPQWEQIDLVMMSYPFLLKQRKLKCNWLDSIVLLNRVNNTLYPN